MSEEKYSNEDELKKFIESQETGEPAPKEVKTPESVGAPIVQTGKEPLPWQGGEARRSLANETGWQQIKLVDLPTQGLFYPKDMEIVIRSATAAEIRHWSTLTETDLSLLDDMLNYILERCVKVKNSKGPASWMDIKEIDRFYLILAVSEYTFIKGENKLQVRISESKKMDVRKEMIEYIKFDDRVMKYYDEDKRCFNLKFRDGSSLLATIPSVGVTNFLKNYVRRKTQAQESIDEDFVSFAPFTILDYRGLNDASYQNYVTESNAWTNMQISGLSMFKEIFTETVNPVIKYTDEEGGERQVPLNFQGGLKSIFLVPDPFG